MSTKKTASISKLVAAYSSWLAASAAVENMNACPALSDAKCTALISAETAAVWLVISAPLCNEKDVSTLAKFLSALHLDEIESDYADGRFQAAVAKLTSHLCRK